MLYKSEVAVANQSGAMGAETISKNGRSLKSQMSRGNTFIFVVAIFVAISLGAGLSGCGNVSASSSGFSTNVSKIPDGTYVRAFSERTITISGNKINIQIGSLSDNTN